MLREAISKHPWSFLSMLISVGTAIVTLILIQYLYRHGSWRPQSSLGSEIQGFGGIAVLLSFVTSLVAIIKERPPAYGLLALLLSAASFFLYVR